jgi:hypothetical protein
MAVAAHFTVGDPPGEPKQPFQGRCGECGHVWTVCFLPMAMDRAARLMSAAACPKGCDASVYPAITPTTPGATQ